MKIAMLLMLSGCNLVFGIDPDDVKPDAAIAPLDAPLDASSHDGSSPDMMLDAAAPDAPPYLYDGQLALEISLTSFCVGGTYGGGVSLSKPPTQPITVTITSAAPNQLQVLTASIKLDATNTSWPVSFKALAPSSGPITLTATTPGAAAATDAVSVEACP